MTLAPLSTVALFSVQVDAWEVGLEGAAGLGQNGGFGKMQEMREVPPVGYVNV